MLYQRTGHVCKRRCIYPPAFLQYSFRRKYAQGIVQNPTEGALNGMKHLAAYLMNYGRIIHNFPWYTDTGTYNMVAPAGFDFAGCSQTKRSTSGGGILFNGVLVPNWSKTQPTIAQSTCEAEYVSANFAGMKAVGLNNVLKEVDLCCENDTVLCDASSAIGVAKDQELEKSGIFTWPIFGCNKT